MIENKELKNEIKELKLKNIDESKYLEWDYEEIVSWIISLDNGRYCKYEEKLKTELNGTNLQRVDQNDIKSWGVKKFDDKKDLYLAIQDLVNKSNKKQNVNNNNMNEGDNVPTAYI